MMRTLAGTPSTFYSLSMPSEVVVVKRSRRRAFALLWAAPAWLRSIAVGARSLLDAQTPAIEGPEAARLRGETLMQAPTLVRDEEGHHACTGCGACVEVCPSRCLELHGAPEASGAGGAAGLERFELDLGRCIGCGDCVAVCPESALRAESIGSACFVTAPGKNLRRDLLAEGVLS